MAKIRPTRRRLVQTAATVALAAPFVRGAPAAGKLAVGFWDHWVPGANDTLTKLCQEWAAKEKVEIAIDYITSQGEKAQSDPGSRGPGTLGARHPDLPDLGGPLPGRQSRTGRRSDGGADQGERQGQRECRICRQAKGPLDRRAGNRRQPDLAALCPHRSLQGTCRARSDQDVPGRGAAPQ